MPTNREKRPRWLMICKCGATVKASTQAAEIGDSGTDLSGRRAGHLRLGRVKRTGSARVVQAFGTSEVRSRGVTTPCGVHWRWPVRWNSIRRSNALERMNGKRWNTRSRISW